MSTHFKRENIHFGHFLSQQQINILGLFLRFAVVNFLYNDFTRESH